MSAEVVTEAVLARAVTTGESDRVVTLLTRDLGKISAIARGANKSRSRFGAGLAPLVIGMAALKERRGQELYWLERYEVKRDFTRVASDPVKFAHASYVTELLRELWAPRHADPGLFELIEGAYQAIADHPPSADLLRAFELGVLDGLGLRPALDRCLSCGASELARLDEPGAVLDPGLGGLRCARCAPRATAAGVRPLPAAARRRLAEAQQLGPGEAAALPPLASEHAACAREAVHALLATHLPGKLRSLEYIRQLRGG